MAIPIIVWLMLLASGLALMTQIINKLVINEKKVDGNRADMKRLQKELKGMDPKSKEFQTKQNELMDKNWWIMKQQFRPMMFTMIPYLVIFYFVSSIFAFNPIAVGSMVGVDISGQGDVVSECLGLDTTVSGKFSEVVEVTTEDCTAMMAGSEIDLNIIDENDEKKFEAGDLKMTITPPEKEYVKMPFKLPLIGTSLGWLGTFILTSIASSLILTKVLKGRYLRKWE